ncbi:MAG: DUF3592 domain-containing protein [Flavobacteriales bacterium]|nr:DUF3592 domain-containing protein [Flavobacteriales bacterium]
MDFSDNQKLVLSIVLGVAVVAILIWRLAPLMFFKLSAISVPGRITNWMSMKEGGKPYFYPMIEFATLDGQSITTRADDRCEGRPIYPVGTKVIVHYHKKDPRNFRIEYPES